MCQVWGKKEKLGFGRTKNPKYGRLAGGADIVCALSGRRSWGGRFINGEPVPAVRFGTKTEGEKDTEKGASRCHWFGPRKGYGINASKTRGNNTAKAG